MISDIAVMEEIRIRTISEPAVGVFRRLSDWLFGYDFFISYAHKDGANYPSALNAHLQTLGYKNFLDKTEYVPGLDLRQATRRRVRMSQKLIVVARPEALKSEWVSREVEIHLNAGKTPILININDAVHKAPATAQLARLAQEQHWLRIEEVLPEIDCDPTNECVQELSRAFNAMRQETKRTRFFQIATAIFALLVDKF